MKTGDLIVVNLDGKVVEGNKKPTSELYMHLQIYKERLDINSVCHLHPPYATGFAVAGIPLDQYVLTEVVITLGKIPLVEYGTPGTEEFYKSIQPLIHDYDAFLLAHHGALTLGTDVFSAYNRMETLEHVAHIVFIAKQLGNVTTLNSEQVQKIIAQRERFGIRKDVGSKSDNVV
jgi:L-fuculose-phosphate aldolase